MDIYQQMDTPSSHENDARLAGQPEIAMPAVVEDKENGERRAGPHSILV